MNTCLRYKARVRFNRCKPVSEAGGSSLRPHLTVAQQYVDSSLCYRYSYAQVCCSGCPWGVRFYFASSGRGGLQSHSGYSSFARCLTREIRVEVCCLMVIG